MGRRILTSAVALPPASVRRLAGRTVVCGAYSARRRTRSVGTLPNGALLGTEAVSANCGRRRRRARRVSLLCRRIECARRRAVSRASCGIGCGRHAIRVQTKGIPQPRSRYLLSHCDNRRNSVSRPASQGIRLALCRRRAFMDHLPARRDIRHRHRRLFSRQSVRLSQTRAKGQSKQNVGRAR